MSERLRRHEERSAAPRPPEPAAEHAVLALQRAAGNRAVGAMLAREAEAKPAEATIDLGKLGAFKVEGANHSADGKEVVVYIPADPKVLDAAAKSERIPVAKLTMQGRTITMHDVYISSYSVSGDSVALTLNAGSIRFDDAKGGLDMPQSPTWRDSPDAGS